jgi:hypothetical protein
MADPEIPEVRGEIQREDRPQAAPRYDKAPPPLGPKIWLWVAFAVAIVAVIALVYNVA